MVAVLEYMTKLGFATADMEIRGRKRWAIFDIAVPGDSGIWMSFRGEEIRFVT